MSWEYLLTYDQIGRVALIAIMAAPNILIPFILATMIYKTFIKYLQGFIDRLEDLLVKLSLEEEAEAEKERDD